jgi:hypothetical protein
VKLRRVHGHLKIIVRIILTKVPAQGQVAFVLGMEALAKVGLSRRVLATELMRKKEIG